MIGAELVCDLAQVGVTVEAVDGQLIVRPLSALQPEHRAALRERRLEMLDALADRDAWRIAAKASNTHHLRCVTCQAAGRGARYGQRCDVGRLLWVNYEAAFEQAHAVAPAGPAID